MDIFNLLEVHQYLIHSQKNAWNRVYLILRVNNYFFEITPFAQNLKCLTSNLLIS